MNPKVLVLGHGWCPWKLRCEPRCAPMDIDEWNDLVQNAPKDALTFLDFDKNEEPDIRENVCNDWRPHLQNRAASYSYDYVIDTICHFDVKVRRYSNYWEGVKCALKEDGVYIGWNDAKGIKDKQQRKLRLSKAQIDEHVAKTYTTLYTTDKPLEVL